MFRHSRTLWCLCFFVHTQLLHIGKFCADINIVLIDLYSNILSKVCHRINGYGYFIATHIWWCFGCSFYYPKSQHTFCLHLGFFCTFFCWNLFFYWHSTWMWKVDHIHRKMIFKWMEEQSCSYTLSLVLCLLSSIAYTLRYTHHPQIFTLVFFRFYYKNARTHTHTHKTERNFNVFAFFQPTSQPASHQFKTHHFKYIWKGIRACDCVRVFRTHFTAVCEP